MLICSEHQEECKLVPAGVSKTTGRPYNAFWACPEKGCRAEKIEVDGESSEPRPGFQAFKGIIEKPKAEEKPEVDWDAKDRQSMAQTAMKSASEIVAAMIPTWGAVSITDTRERVNQIANDFFQEIVKMKG